jgi:cell shape-determining protein MreD
MKLASLLAASVVLLALECALLRPFCLSVARADVAVVFVLLFALRLNTLEGVVGAAAVGYFVDVLSGQPGGLPVFAAVLTFLVARFASPFVEAKGVASFAALCAPIDAFYNLTVWLLSLLGTSAGQSRAAMLRAVPATAALTALAALLLWPALRRLEAAFEKPDTGLLR